MELLVVLLLLLVAQWFGLVLVESLFTCFSWVLELFGISWLRLLFVDWCLLGCLALFRLAWTYWCRYLFAILALVCYWYWCAVCFVLRWLLWILWVAWFNDCVLGIDVVFCLLGLHLLILLGGTRRCWCLWLIWFCLFVDLFVSLDFAICCLFVCLARSCCFVLITFWLWLIWICFYLFVDWLISWCWCDCLCLLVWPCGTLLWVRFMFWFDVFAVVSVNGFLCGCLVTWFWFGSFSWFDLICFRLDFMLFVELMIVYLVCLFWMLDCGFCVCDCLVCLFMIDFDDLFFVWLVCCLMLDFVID